MTDISKLRPFPSAEEDARSANICLKTPQTESPAYRLAYLDAEFMLQEALRPVRQQLVRLKPELEQQPA